MIECSRTNVRCGLAQLAIAVSLTLAVMLAATPVLAGSVQPATPQPEAGALKPGLAVDYYYVAVRSLDEFYPWLESKKPDPGAPLATLDFVSNQDGPVLGVDRGSLVIAIITGFIRFPESGQFKMLALVNDGLRLYVGQGNETPILEDQRVQSDRLVGPEEITVEAGIWYPMKLEYFQRRGTSALVLAWMRPGAGEGEEEVIEAEFFAHLPE